MHILAPQALMAAPLHESLDACALDALLSDAAAASSRASLSAAPRRGSSRSCGEGAGGSPPRSRGCEGASPRLPRRPPGPLRHLPAPACLACAREARASAASPAPHLPPASASAAGQPQAAVAAAARGLDWPGVAEAPPLTSTRPAFGPARRRTRRRFVPQTPPAWPALEARHPGSRRRFSRCPSPVSASRRPRLASLPHWPL